MLFRSGAGFEMQLTGGLHNGFSGSSGNSSSADAPNLAAMMGENSASNGNHPGGTAISPSQILRDAAEEGEYSGQGSLPGVSEKKDASLFVITKTKLTKMIRIGNIGMPKNVEVKN